MKAATDTYFLRTLAIVLSTHVAAFVVFHLNIGLIFDMRFVRLIRAYDWPRDIYTIIHFLALYTPVAIFLRMVFSKRYNVPLLLVMAGGTLYYAYKWHYPILTAFLFTIGQFEMHGEFVIRNMPGLDQYPEFQSEN
ncbi:MAG: hypothetical protein N4A53_11170 [Pelagimonas sp.]|jgi:hypothetical protein|nr:hypothetical protein [Pelagimonas sp.]